MPAPSEARRPSEIPNSLDAQFDRATTALVTYMRDVKGGVSFVPSRKRPERDYTTVCSSGEGGDLVTLDLHAFNMWSATRGGIWEPIGMVDEITPDDLLPFYASMTDSGLAVALSSSGAVSFDQLLDESIPLEERQRIYTEQAGPIQQKYITENRDRLMDGLINDMRAALGRVIGFPQIKRP